MNAFYFGQALNLASLYMIAGTGAAFSIKSGNLNFGGEGQIYLGGFICAIFLSKAQTLPAAVAIPLSLILAFSVSGLLALISGLLKYYKNADFLFTSFLASSAIIPIIDGLITGPFRSKTDNLLATPFIAENFRFASILKPSSLNASFFIAMILCAFFFILIYKTAYGRKLTIYGISPRFAEFSLYNNSNFVFTSAFVSGGMHGLCGAFSIVGTYFTCHNGFYSGIGWSSFSTALLANANPLLMIPSSIFLGFVTTFSNKYAMYHNFGFDMSSLIQSVILIVISFTLYRQEEQHHD